MTDLEFDREDRGAPVDVLDKRLNEIAERCDVSELQNLEDLRVIIRHWRRVNNNPHVYETKFTYEQFAEDCFGQILEDIQNARDGMKC